MVFSQASRRLLLASVGLSALAAFKHASTFINEFFPVLDASLEAIPLVAFSAKSKLLQPNGSNKWLISDIRSLVTYESTLYAW